jgi:hypothetical protein
MSQQQSSNDKTCKYCNTQLLRFARNDTDTGWIKYDLDGSVHSIPKCKAIQANKGISTAANKTTSSNKQGLGKYLPIKGTTENKIIEPTLQSIYAKQIFHSKEIAEIKKGLDSIVTLLDDISQQNTLIIKNMGYPQPEPVISVSDSELESDNTTVPNNTNNMSEWKPISEEFECHACNMKKFNGMTKYDAKICEDCYADMNEIGGGIKQEPETMSLNTVEQDITGVGEEEVG